MKIIVIGPVGSGKTMASDYIAFALKYALITFDKSQRRGTLMLNIIDLFLQKQIEDNFVLDGFPADIQELSVAKDLFQPDLVVYVDANDFDCVQHIMGRSYDKKTGTIYHLLNSPPDPEKVKSGEIELTDPEPCNSNVLVRQISFSRKLLEPLKSYYGERSKVRIVKSADDAKTLTDELSNLIDELKKQSGK